MATQPSSSDQGSIASAELITLTADIVAAHLSNNNVQRDQIPQLIQSVYQALSELGQQQKEEVRPDPAVSIRSSVKQGHIVCLEDGKKMKMLKRHLMTDHGLTPNEYRARWGLPADYPMVAPEYAEKRRGLALKIGLGRKPGKVQRKQAAKRAGNAATQRRSTKPVNGAKLKDK